MGGRKNKTKVCDKVSLEDRISQLPDHLISEILCHVSTEDAVRTSVLSSRWRNLWQSVPELDLHSCGFYSDANSFVSFAEKFFDPHKDYWVRKLRLRMDNPPDDKSFLNRWIDAVSRRRIQHLHLRLYYFNYFNSSDSILPLSIYTCQTLVHLKLCRATLVNAEVVSLPCLKIIHLEGTTCPDPATLEKLISGSPLLEDLTFSKHIIAMVLQVRSQTLKRIHIDEPYSKVVIDAPLLQFLSICIYTIKNFEIINLGFSTKLDISSFSNVVYSGNLIHGILTDIFRVRDLVISHVFWKHIFPYPKSGQVLQFCNLSHLNTRFCITDLEMLPTLLDSCPKLESLILVLIDPLIMSPKKKNQPKGTFSKVPQCLVSSLKLVALKRSFPVYEGEMEVVRYLLKNSTILEKLKLDVYYKKNAECDFLKQLLTLPRCSSTCEIHCSFVPKKRRF